MAGLLYATRAQAPIGPGQEGDGERRLITGNREERVHVVDARPTVIAEAVVYACGRGFAHQERVHVVDALPTVIAEAACTRCGRGFAH